MSFTSYDNLVSAIGSWLGRSDLAAQIPDFIRLAEARMQRELKAFSTRGDLFALPLSATTGRTSAYPGLPGIAAVTFVGIRVLDATLAANPPKPLIQVTESQLREWQADFPQTGEPEAYAVVGQQIGVYPFPNVPNDSLGVPSSYQVMLSTVGASASFAVPISSANFASNPLVSEHPDLYLYGALAESAPYLQHDERVPVWEARFTKIVKDVNIQHDRLLGDSPRLQLSRVF